MGTAGVYVLFEPPCIYTHTHMRICLIYDGVCVFIEIQYIYTDIQRHVCVYAHLNTRVYMYINTYMYTYPDVYMYIYI